MKTLLVLAEHPEFPEAVRAGRRGVRYCRRTARRHPSSAGGIAVGRNLHGRAQGGVSARQRHDSGGVQGRRRRSPGDGTRSEASAALQAEQGLIVDDLTALRVLHLVLVWGPVSCRKSAGQCRQVGAIGLRSENPSVRSGPVTFFVAHSRLATTRGLVLLSVLLTTVS